MPRAAVARSPGRDGLPRPGTPRADALRAARHRSMSQTVKDLLEGASAARRGARGARSAAFQQPTLGASSGLAPDALAPRPAAAPRADTGVEAAVPLANVSSKILSKVIEYCKYHVDADKTEGEGGAPAVKEEEVKAWDTEFVKVDQGTLFELILVRAAPASRCFSSDSDTPWVPCRLAHARIRPRRHRRPPTSSTSNRCWT